MALLGSQSFSTQRTAFPKKQIYALPQMVERPQNEQWSVTSVRMYIPQRKHGTKDKGAEFIKQEKNPSAVKSKEVHRKAEGKRQRKGTVLIRTWRRSAQSNIIRQPRMNKVGPTKNVNILCFAEDLELPQEMTSSIPGPVTPSHPLISIGLWYLASI